MEVRLLQAGERFEADMISTVAFHGRIEDIGKAKEKSAQSTVEDWGAFDGGGRMAARIINNRYLFRLDGHTVRAGGIGAVSTLPEYRGQGAIRDIFGRLLPAAYENGELLSALYPFSHAFYRRFGYETVCWRGDYEAEPAVFGEYRFSGTAELWKPGDPAEPFTEIFNRCAAEYNLSALRDDGMTGEHLGGEYWKDRKFAYLLRQEGRPAAYLIFQDLRHDPGAILEVRDLAWDGREGLNAILGFLARFTSDYGTVRFYLPREIELLSILHSPDAYGVRRTARQDFMLRAVNVPRLLEIIKKPADCRFVIRVTGDAQIPGNNGTWAVEGNAASPAEEAPDLTVSVQAFAQLAAGAVSLSEALYRPDVAVHGREETLQRIFVRKPVMVTEHF